MRLSFKKRPFVPLTALLAAGIVVSRVAEWELRTGLLLFCGAACGLAFRAARWWCCACGVFALGAVLYSSRYEILLENDLRLILNEHPVLATVRGRLLETPSVKTFPGRTNSVDYSYARVRVSEILMEKQWRPAAGTVATTTRGVFDPSVFKGRRVEVYGIVEPPRKALAPGMFDFHQYLYNARIFFQLRCEGASDWQLTSFEPLPLAERFQRWANQQLARGLPGPDEPLNMVRAMVLGATRSLDGEVAEVFQKTGTMHIIAISGLHVACIAASILGLLRLLGLPRHRAALIIIPLVWFYTLATGWQSSAVRSALMSTFVFAGWAIRRPTELLNSTAGAALLILIVEPEQLFQASFQLSFFVVTAIALFLGVGGSPVEQWSETVKSRLLGYDPLLPPELRPRWKQAFEVPLMLLLGNVAVSAASWIGSAPLTAYYFNLVTPISLVANLVAVPLSSIALASTLGSLLLPPLGPVFNYLSWATMWETIVVTRWLSQFGWGYFYVPKPGIWTFLLHIGLVALVSAPTLRAPALRRYGISLVLVLLAGWSFALYSSSRRTVVTVLPAAGNPVFIDAPGRRNDLLIDCSNLRGSEHLVERFLRGQGIGRLRNLLLTQGTVSHVGGFHRLDEEFRPKCVFASLAPGRSRPYKELLAKLEDTPRLQKVREGDTAAGWTILNPPAGRTRARAADNAVVLKRRINDWNILILPGLGRLGQEDLLAVSAELGADILIICEPESGEPLRVDLLERIGPKLILFAAAEQPFRRHDGTWETTLAALGVPFLSTGKAGAIQMTVNRRHIETGNSFGSGSVLLEKR